MVKEAITVLAPDRKLGEPQLSFQEVEVLARLAKSIKRKDTFVELGTWTGQSASVIGTEAKMSGGHLYCIDHWRGNEGTTLAQIAQQEDIFGLFRRNMETLQIWDYITAISKDSLIASKEFADRSIDFLFIDADHRYSPFLQDLQTWWPKLRSGGLICGHDCEGHYCDYPVNVKRCIDSHLDIDCTGGYHAGVIKALHDYFCDEYFLVPYTRLWFKWAS